MVAITIDVPDAQVPAFYQFVGKFLAGELLDQGAPEGASGPTSAPPRQEWGDSAEDHADAVTLWRKFSPNARAVFGLLIDNPDVRYTGDEIAEAAGIPNGAHGVAGVLAWPGRHSVKIGRGLPSHWNEDPDTGVSHYWTTPERAALFAAARAEVEGAS